MPTPVITTIADWTLGCSNLLSVANCPRSSFNKEELNAETRLPLTAALDPWRSKFVPSEISLVRGDSAKFFASRFAYRKSTFSMCLEVSEWSRPAEGRGHIVRSLFFSLQGQKACRQRHARGLRLELHDKRQVQEVLLSRDKKERAVFLDVPA